MGDSAFGDKKGRDLSGSLMVMLTYACQADCAYCLVDHGARTVRPRRLPVHMPRETLLRAVDLLLTSSCPAPQLRFFGGEPLLRFGLLREAVEHGLRRARGRDLRFMVTTNGMGLDREKLRWLSRRPVEIMFSADGRAATHRRLRPAKNGRPYHASLLKNLDALLDSGLPCFVNVVVVPGGLERAEADLAFLVRRGVRRAQICYQVGVRWGASGLRGLGAFFRRLAASPPGGLEIMNLHNDCEPVMLSDEILADTDGTILLDGAVFLERAFPGLREPFRLGRLGGVRRMGSLVRSRREVLALFQRACPPGSPGSVLLADNLRVGMELRKLFRDMGRRRRTC